MVIMFLNMRLRVTKIDARSYECVYDMHCAINESMQIAFKCINVLFYFETSFHGFVHLHTFI